MNTPYTWSNLLYKYLCGTLTPEEQIDFDAQKAASPAKQYEWERLTTPENFEDDIALFANADPQAAWQRFKAAHPNCIRSTQKHFIHRRWLPVMSAAAALLLALGMYVWQGSDSRHLSVTGHMQHRITLSDGSVVWMDTTAVLEYPMAFTGTQREVTVTGTCYFTIRKDSLHPFIVHLRSGGQVEVTGTRFTVQDAEGRAPIVSLLEGAVRVRRGEEVIALLPGEQVVLNNDSIQRITGIQQQAQWVYQLTYFDCKGLNLQQVIIQLGAYYNKQVVFRGHFNDAPASATFPRDVPLNTILQSLKTMHAFNYEETTDSLVVTGLY